MHSFPSRPAHHLGFRVAKMVGPDGLEPSTPRLSSACSNQLSYEPIQNGALGPRPAGRVGGAGRTRTGDPLLAKQVLYQLSYGPRLGYKGCYLKNVAE